MKRRILPLVLVLPLLAGCAGDLTVGDQSDAMRPTSWEVVGFRIPGISAMTFEDALTYEGRQIQYGPKQATSGPDICDLPVYQSTHEPAATYLTTQFNLRPEDTGLSLDEGTTLEVMRVTCADQPWSAIGGLVLWESNQRGFAIYDGVFFDIEPSG